jgi:hypothetical protein
MDAKTKAALKKEYPEIRLHKVPVAEYKKHGKTDVRYYLLEAFNPVHDLDRIIVLGADMLCVGSADALIYRADAPISMWKEPVRDCFNSGGMVLLRPILTQQVYEDLLAHDKGKEFGRDQGIINSYFAGKIAELPSTVQVFAEKGCVTTGVTFLHFIHKPFARRDSWERAEPEAIRILEEYQKEYSLGVWENFLK